MIREFLDILLDIQQNNKDLVKKLENCKHSFNGDSPNVFHLEDNCWAHTLMVSRFAEFLESSPVVLYATLLHDLGKPDVREEIKETKRVRFFGHEGLSFFRALDVLSKDKGLTEEEKRKILTVVNLHGDLYVDSYKKLFNYYSLEDYEVLKDVVEHIKSDHLGRLTTKRTKGFLEKTIDFLELVGSKKEKEGIFANKMIMLVGVPGSGKSTIRDKKLQVVSRDDLLMEYAKDQSILGDYNCVWEKLTDGDQKQIDVLLMEKFNGLWKKGVDFTIDMTNVSRKSRKKWLSGLPKSYQKVAHVMATGYETVMERNKNRVGKKIPEFVIKNMMKGFCVPTYGEFDEIHWNFEK